MDDCVIKVHVIPNSGSFKVESFNEWNDSLKVRVKEKAFKGKANLELERELKKFFGKEARIIKGEKSKDKKVLIENSSFKEIKEKIAFLK